MKREMLNLAERFGLEPDELAPHDILTVVETGRTLLLDAGRIGEAAAFRNQAFDHLAEIEIAHCANPIELPGAAETLAWLSVRSVPVAIVTRNCRAVSEQLIAHAGLRCRALVAREDVARTKPHPDHLHAALHALECDISCAADCLMAGDNRMDVEAGKAAGMRTLGLRRNKPPESFAGASPDLLLNDMAEVWAALRDEA